MKKTLYFIAAVSMVASTAMASKSRLSALGAADNALTQNISDVQTIFVNPADMHYVGDFVTFEMGETPLTPLAASNNDAFGAVVPNAEGGFITTSGDSKFGFYLGKMSMDTNSYRAAGNIAINTVNATPTAQHFLSQENPFEVFYGAKAGDMSWGASFTYSNSQKKTTDQKQNAMGLRMGVKTDDWAAFANIGLGAQATEGQASVKSTAGLILGGSYNMDNAKIYGQFQNAGAKALYTNGTTELFDKTVSTTTLGFMNAWKNDGNLAFYSVALQMDSDENKTAKDKTVTSAVPVTMGAEVLAASWLKLRGSITQNLLMGTKKVTTGGVAGKEDSIAHNTETAAGAGLVWGRSNLDVVMTMGTDGSLDASTLGANASYTYTF